MLHYELLLYWNYQINVQAFCNLLRYFAHMFTQGYHAYYIYIITNKTKSVLYTGVTNNLARRLYEHSENIKLKKNTFAGRYNCRHLLYYEEFTWILEAIAREKEIKGWRREKKLELIKTINPYMKFLEQLFPYEPN